jgi:hypothetical protein
VKPERWAYLKDDGRTWAVCGDNYLNRDELRELGGKWKPQHRQWHVPGGAALEPVLRSLGVTLKVRRLRAAFCHEPAEPIWVPELQAAMGHTEGSLFCSRCDSHYRAPVALTLIGQPAAEEVI